jgi:hypothetical protein
MEEGVAIDIPAKMGTALQAKGMSPKAAMIETLLSGAAWGNERKRRANYDVADRCHRCGASNISPTRFYSACLALNNIDIDAVEASQHLVRRATVQGVDLPCLYFRGLIPHPLLDIPDPAPNISVNLLNKGSIQQHDGPVHSFTDGSGCQDGSSSIADAQIAQIAPRAEPIALLRALEHEAILHSDAKYVVQSYNSRNRSRRKGRRKNADLWNRIFSMKRSRTSQFSVAKVKAHSDANDLTYGFLPHQSH